MSDGAAIRASASRDGVTAEISLTFPADAFRGELVQALEMALHRVRAAIDEHYATGRTR